jgi:hypothetical protein
MRHLAWSLLIGGLAGLGAGPFFASAAFAQRGGGGGGHFGNAMPGSPLGNQQMLLPPGLNPAYGIQQGPGSISPSIGGVNSNGAVVGGTANGGFYGSPGSMSAAIGGVNGSGAVVGGYLNGGNYGVSPGMNVSWGVGGVNGSGAMYGGSLDGGRYGSPGSIISPGIGGVNGSGAVVGGALDGGRYGSPGSFSPTVGGVNGRGAAIAGTLNSGYQGFQRGIGANGEFKTVPNEQYRAATPIGVTGANFFPSSANVASTQSVPVAIVVPSDINSMTTVNPAPIFVQTVEGGDGGGGNFQYSWW